MKMSLHRLLLVPLALLFTVSWLEPAQGQQVVNGSFELDVASTTVPNPGTGWTYSGPAQGEYIYNNSFAHGMTSYGSQWLFLPNGVITQTIAGGFTIGQTYELHFSASDIEGGTVPFIYGSVSGAASTGNVMFSLARSSSYYTNSAMPFVSCVLTFVPTAAGPITIQIGAPQYPAAVDNVYLVPEPSTWVMSGFGLAGAGIVFLRRARMLA